MAEVAEPAPETAVGLVCVACGETAWKVTHTRLGQAAVRRWRRCLGCGHTVRTRETIEAEPHPDHDRA